MIPKFWHDYSCTLELTREHDDTQQGLPRSDGTAHGFKAAARQQHPLPLYSAPVGLHDAVSS